MRQPRVTVSPEIALVDQAVFGAVEDGAPFLEFIHTGGCLLGVQLCHAPNVEELAAAHRVAEMDLPVVFGVHVAQGCRHTALGHDRMRLAEQAFGDDAGTEPLGAAFDGSAQASSSGADHEHVVFDGLDFCDVHSHVFRSSMTPNEHIRMYRSVNITQPRLAHAKAMWRPLNQEAPFQALCFSVCCPQLMQSDRPPIRWRNE